MTKNTITILTTLTLLLNLRTGQAGSATWNLNPTSGDWNTAANWTPATVPNDPADIATLGVSNLTTLQISADVALDSLIFAEGGSAYGITMNGISLNLWGGGVINESSQPQTLLLSNIYSTLIFRNNATAGDLLTYEITSSNSHISFLQTSSARSANFVIDGPFNENASGIYFFDDSMAEDGTFTITGNSFVTLAGDSTAANGVFTTSNGGSLFFTGGHGGNCTIVNQGASSGGGFVGRTLFNSITSSAETATITAEGGAVSGAQGATVEFFNASAGSATILLEGGSVNGAGGASANFQHFGSAGNATITLTGGANGGKGALILFNASADGGTARLELLGSDATLDISNRKLPGMSIGSIEGDGLIFLGRNNLIVGGNNLTTSFSGVVQDGGSHGGTGGSLSKVGSGSLTLGGANLYTGGTTIDAGELAVNNTTGSATGTGAVQVNAGTLSGRGNIAGAVTIGTGGGTGAFLAPGQGASQTITLTMQSALTFKADGTYNYRLKTKKAEADQVIANGVTIESGAQFSFKQLANKKLVAGTVFTAISNTSANSISGAFANLPDDSTFTVGRNIYQANYQGGDGNDLTLTVIL